MSEMIDVSSVYKMQKSKSSPNIQFLIPFFENISLQSIQDTFTLFEDEKRKKQSEDYHKFIHHCQNHAWQNTNELYVPSIVSIEFYIK